MTLHYNLYKNLNLKSKLLLIGLLINSLFSFAQSPAFEAEINYPDIELCGNSTTNTTLVLSNVPPGSYSVGVNSNNNLVGVSIIGTNSLFVPPNTQQPISLPLSLNINCNGQIPNSAQISITLDVTLTPTSSSSPTLPPAFTQLRLQSPQINIETRGFGYANGTFVPNINLPITPGNPSTPPVIPSCSSCACSTNAMQVYKLLRATIIGQSSLSLNTYQVKVQDADAVNLMYMNQSGSLQSIAFSNGSATFVSSNGLFLPQSSTQAPYFEFWVQYCINGTTCHTPFNSTTNLEWRCVNNPSCYLNEASSFYIVQPQQEPDLAVAVLDASFNGCYTGNGVTSSYTLRIENRGIVPANDVRIRFNDLLPNNNSIPTLNNVNFSGNEYLLGTLSTGTTYIYSLNVNTTAPTPNSSCPVAEQWMNNFNILYSYESNCQPGTRILDLVSPSILPPSLKRMYYGSNNITIPAVSALTGWSGTGSAGTLSQSTPTPLTWYFNDLNLWFSQPPTPVQLRARITIPNGFDFNNIPGSILLNGSTITPTVTTTNGSMGEIETVEIAFSSNELSPTSTNSVTITLIPDCVEFESSFVQDLKFEIFHFPNVGGFSTCSLLVACSSSPLALNCPGCQTYVALTEHATATRIDGSLGYDQERPAYFGSNATPQTGTFSQNRVMPGDRFSVFLDGTINNYSNSQLTLSGLVPDPQRNNILGFPYMYMRIAFKNLNNNGLRNPTCDIVKAEYSNYHIKFRYIKPGVSIPDVIINQTSPDVHYDSDLNEFWLDIGSIFPNQIFTQGDQFEVEAVYQIAGNPSTQFTIENITVDFKVYTALQPEDYSILTNHLINFHDLGVSLNNLYSDANGFFTAPSSNISTNYPNYYSGLSLPQSINNVNQLQFACVNVSSPVIEVGRLDIKPNVFWTNEEAYCSGIFIAEDQNGGSEGYISVGGETDDDFFRNETRPFFKISSVFYTTNPTIFNTNQAAVGNIPLSNYTSGSHEGISTGMRISTNYEGCWQTPPGFNETLRTIYDAETSILSCNLCPVTPPTVTKLREEIIEDILAQLTPNSSITVNSNARTVTQNFQRNPLQRSLTGPTSLNATYSVSSPNIYYDWVVPVTINGTGQLGIGSLSASLDNLLNGFSIVNLCISSSPTPCSPISTNPTIISNNLSLRPGSTVYVHVKLEAQCSTNPSGSIILKVNGICGQQLNSSTCSNELQVQLNYIPNLLARPLIMNVTQHSTTAVSNCQQSLSFLLQNAGVTELQNPNCSLRLLSGSAVVTFANGNAIQINTVGPVNISNLLPPTFQGNDGTYALNFDIDITTCDPYAVLEINFSGTDVCQNSKISTYRMYPLIQGPVHNFDLIGIANNSPLNPLSVTYCNLLTPLPPSTPPSIGPNIDVDNLELIPVLISGTGIAQSLTPNNRISVEISDDFILGDPTGPNSIYYTQIGSPSTSGSNLEYVYQIDENTPIGQNNLLPLLTIPIYRNNNAPICSTYNVEVTPGSAFDNNNVCPGTSVCQAGISWNTNSSTNVAIEVERPNVLTGINVDGQNLSNGQIHDLCIQSNQLVEINCVLSNNTCSGSCSLVVLDPNGSTVPVTSTADHYNLNISGTYIVTATYDNAWGCKDELVCTLVVSNLTVTIAQIQNCPNQFPNLNAQVTGSNGSVTYDWSPDNNNPSNTLNNTNQSNSTGLYSLTVTDDFGCSATASTLVSTPTDPKVIITETTLDCGFVMLEATLTSPCNSCSLQYAWSNQLSVNQILVPANGQSVSVTVTGSINGSSCFVLTDNIDVSTSNQSVFSNIEINYNHNGNCGNAMIYFSECAMLLSSINLPLYARYIDNTGATQEISVTNGAFEPAGFFTYEIGYYSGSVWIPLFTYTYNLENCIRSAYKMAGGVQQTTASAPLVLGANQTSFTYDELLTAYRAVFGTGVSIDNDFWSGGNVNPNINQTGNNGVTILGQFQLPNIPNASSPVITISNPRFKMGPGAELLVGRGRQLRIRSIGTFTSIIQSAGKCLWQGIVVEGESNRQLTTTRFDLEKIRIEDACYGVRYKPGRTSTSVTQSTFTKNFVGVLLDGTPSSNVSLSNGGTFWGNVFTNENATLLEPFPNQSHLPDLPDVNELNIHRMAFAGIVAHHLDPSLNLRLGSNGALSEMYTNHFKFLTHGVLLNTSGLSMYNFNMNNIPHPQKIQTYQSFAIPSSSSTGVLPATRQWKGAGTGAGLYATGTPEETAPGKITWQPANRSLIVRNGIVSNVRNAFTVEREYGVDIQNNGLQHVQTGIRIRNNQTRSITLVSNTIMANQDFTVYNIPLYPAEAVGVGIMLTNTRTSSAIANHSHLIQGNTMTSSFSTLATPNATRSQLGTGIWVSESTMGLKYPSLQIKSNTIYLPQSATGIYLLNINSGQDWLPIENNTISIGDASEVRSGIHLANSSRFKVSQNIISGTSPTPANALISGLYPRGIYLQQTSAGDTMSNLIHCNTLFNLRTALRADGRCDNSIVAYNNFGKDETPVKDNFIGVHVTNGGVLGEQPSFNSQLSSYFNKWYGSYTHNNAALQYLHPSGSQQTINGTGAWNLNVEYDPAQGSFTTIPDRSQILLSRFTVSSTLPSGNMQLIPPGVPRASTVLGFDPPIPEWVNIRQNVPFVQSDLDCSTSSPASGFSPASQFLSSTDEQLIFRTYNPQVYPEAEYWTSNKSLLGELKAYEDSLVPGSDLWLFYDSLKQSATGQYLELEFNKARLNYSDSAFNWALGQLQYQEDSLLGMKIIFDSLYQAGSIDSLTYESEMESLAANIDWVSASKDSIYGLYAIRDSLNRAISLDYAYQLSSMAYYQGFKKEVGEIYLRWQDSGEIRPDSADEARLRYIAAQCFLAAGDAVFEARGMLGLQEALNFDDVDLCAQQGYFMRKAPNDSIHAEIAYHFYPVPAMSELSVLKSGAEWDEEQLELLDMQGRTISKLTLPKGGVNSKVMVNSLSSGFYLARIWSREGTMKHSQKLSILR